MFLLLVKLLGQSKLFRISFILLIASPFFLGCLNDTKSRISNKIENENSKFSFPLPQWNIELEDLRSEYKKLFKAKEVKFTRPYFYVSEEEKSYWVKVAFLNPDMGNRTLDEFGKEVALSILQYLTNPDDFERIEIAVTQKRGFIVTFSKNENAFFYLDSLRMNTK